MAKQATGFEPRKEAVRILRVATSGALATLGRDGAPFASFVNVATTHAGEPILLTSRLAVHTANLDRDPRASLLLVDEPQETGDPVATGRLTLTGTVGGHDDDPVIRHRFLARHEEAAGYADFADFGFRRMTLEHGHLVAGFGRIVGLERSRLLTDCAGADDLLAAEESAVAHMNADHGQALSLYATKLLGLPDSDWRMTGADPEGIDLRAGRRSARLAFPERVTTAGELRRVLAELAKLARAES